jgi:hypothetical protein
MVHNSPGKAIAFEVVHHPGNVFHHRSLNLVGWKLGDIGR